MQSRYNKFTSQWFKPLVLQLSSVTGTEFGLKTRLYFSVTSWRGQWKVSPGFRMPAGSDAESQHSHPTSRFWAILNFQSKHPPNQCFASCSHNIPGSCAWNLDGFVVSSNQGQKSSLCCGGEWLHVFSSMSKWPVSNQRMFYGYHQQWCSLCWGQTTNTCHKS